MAVYKGDLLYFATTEKGLRRAKIDAIYYGCTGICLSILLIVIFGAVFPSLLASIFLFPLGVLCIGMGVRSLIIGCLGLFPLKVHSNGLDLPYLNVVDIIKKRTNFLPFEQVNAIYLNKKNKRISYRKSRYIVIRYKKVNGKLQTRAIGKSGIKNLDVFKKVLQNKVKIVKDKYWVVGKGEIEK